MQAIANIIQDMKLKSFNKQNLTKGKKKFSHALAQSGQVNLDLTALKAKLSPLESAKLLQILPSLGHVGEGHCREILLTS